MDDIGDTGGGSTGTGSTTWRVARLTAQGGAAMVELVVLSIVMVPLFFAVPMLGKLVDLEQTAVQAARYAAWETTVDAAGTTPAALPERFFGDRHASIVTGVGRSGADRLWGEGQPPSAGYEADTRVLVRSDAVAAVPYRPARQGGGSVAVGVGTAVEEAGRAMSGFSGFGGDAEWDLAGDGLTLGGVRVDVEKNGWLVAGRGGCVSAGAYACLEELSVILGDGWSAGDDGHAERRIRSLVPANALHDFGDAVAVAGNLPVFKELKGLKDAFGKVDVSALPASERNRRPLERYEDER